MKKILTVLLSFFMVATLGIVNVSAEDAFRFNINSNSEELYYSGESQKLFDFGGIGTGQAGDKTLGSGQNVYYSVTKDYNLNNNSSGYELTWYKYNQAASRNLPIEEKDAGTYYFVAAVITSTEDRVVKTLGQVGANNYRIADSVTINRKAVDVTINRPMATRNSETNEYADPIDYFVVGNSTVEIPFSAECTDASIKWDNTIPSCDSKITFEANADNANKISGTLKVDEVLKSGVYEVTLKATVGDSNNYKDKADSSIKIKIVKPEIDPEGENRRGYTIAFNDNKTRDGSLIYGNTVAQIKEAVKSIQCTVKDGSGNDATFDVWTAADKSAYVKSLSVSDVVFYEGVTAQDDSIIPNAASVSVYSIYEKLTSTYYYKNISDNYWYTGTYNYSVGSYFNIVLKNASATVTGQTLTYNGTAQTIVSAKNVKPGSDSSSTKKATIEYKVSTDVSFDPSSSVNFANIWSNSLSSVTTETKKPERTDADTYYVYYHVNRGNSANYQDIYGGVIATISPKSVVGLTVSTPADVDYDGQAHKQEPTVTDGATQLVKGEDYTLSWSSDDENKCIKAGIVTVTITGKGNYKDTETKTVTYKINPKSITDVTVEGLDSAETYTGSAITKTLTVKDGGTTLVKDTDYTLEYSDNTNAGTATITITGEGNYTGTKEVKFTINSKSVEGLTVSTPDNVNYNGQAHKQEPTVKDGDKDLVKDADYTLSWSSDDENKCINAGTVTVTITGNGNYSGKKTVTYTINSIGFTVENLSDVVYNGESQFEEPVVKDSTTQNVLVKDTDYTLSWSNSADSTDCKKVGNVTVTVTGEGNYTGTAYSTYSITKATAEIKNGTTTTSELTKTYYKNNKGVVKLVSTGVFSDFKGLKISTDGGNTFSEDFIDGSYYDAESGSTIVTLKESYLQTLSYDKDYVFKFVYDTDNYDNTFPTVTLKVRKYTAPSSSSTTTKKVVNTAAY